MSAPRPITRTIPFWLIFVVSTLGGITNAASTPIIPVYVDEVLGGDTGMSGAIMSLAALSSVLAMPFAGFLGDRGGYRLVASTGSALATFSLLAFALLPTVWGAAGARLLFGLGNSAAMTLMLAWLVALAPAEHRGKALGIFGLSVWVGLALGPQLGAWVEGGWGPVAVFFVCAGLEALTAAIILLLPRPAAAPAPPAASGVPRHPLGGLGTAARAVWVPGVVAAAAWCGEGLLVGFLIIHLGSAGVPATGVTGAASVFAVFAVSVIVARLALANLPDRIGPLRATALSLVTLTVGLVVVGLAQGFWLAAAGAVLIGVGFSPLYPSLTMLATRGLPTHNRALGLGLFASFTSVGYGGGALVGGLVIAATSSSWAFLLVAGFQLVALAVVTIFTDDPRPRTATSEITPRDPAA